MAGSWSRPLVSSTPSGHRRWLRVASEREHNQAGVQLSVNVPMPVTIIHRALGQAERCGFA